MTACVNKKHSRRVAAAVSASLVGALTLGAAPAVVMAEEAPVDTLDVLPSDTWDGVDLTWSVEADRFGNYTAEAGEQFILTSATDAFGDPVSMSDLTVAYVAESGNTLDWTGSSDNSLAVFTEAPTKAGGYFAVVINGRVNLRHVTDFAGLKTAIAGKDVKEQKFEVTAMSLEGAFAFEGSNVGDTSFKFTGSPKTVNFADKNGNPIDLSADGVTVTWNTSRSVEDAGTYTATLKGDGTKYSGTATVQLTVDKIDLAKDVITVSPVLAGKNAFNGSNGTGVLDQQGYATNGMTIMVNGEYLALDVVQCLAQSVVLADNSVVNPATSYEGNSPAKVTLKVTANPALSANFVDASAEQMVDTVVVSAFVSDYYYDGDTISGSSLKFETAKGEAFNPSLITASFGGKDIPVDVVVTKDGKKVTEYTEPGTYTAVVTCAVPDDLSYAGTKVIDVTVISRRYSEQPKAYVAVDGKDASNPVEYDGEAVEPVIAVKAGGATLAEGTDYTVTYKDASGKAVESIVEPGEYTGTIDFGKAVIVKNGTTTPVQNVTFTVTVTKAKIRSAKADKEVYAWTGEAVKPIFTAFTGSDLDGLSVEIDPAKTGVSYYKAVERTDIKNPWDPTDDVKYWAPTGSAIKASDLKGAGTYMALVTVPADDAHFTGERYSEVFRIAKDAGFADVDASAWYASVVYKAKELGYVNGLAGTDLFAPGANITRGDVACILFNMAGGDNVMGDFQYSESAGWITGFDDVDGHAYYAKAIAWAKASGVINGYADGTFKPAQNITRQEFACMLANYAKSMGDFEAPSADALDSMPDAGLVADFAEESVAWAVENDVMGNGGSIAPGSAITRAEVAAMAVNYQPEKLVVE